MAESEHTGWDAIGDAYGISTDELFFQMINDIMRYNIQKDPIPFKQDKKTTEPVEFFLNMGFININGTAIHIGKIPVFEKKEIPTILPYSFLCGYACS